MNRHALWLALVLCLAPCAAWARDICIQHDTTGHVVVLKGVAKGAKAVTAYFATFQSITPAGQPVYHFRPMSGSVLLSSKETLSAGLTDFFMQMDEKGTTNFFREDVTFHRISCTPGFNDKLDVLDGCTDILMTHRSNELPFATSVLGHIIPCASVPKVP
jgi:hypothetical protein